MSLTSTSHSTQSTHTPALSLHNKIKSPCTDPAILAWAKEHARHVDERNTSWVKVFGEQLEADDIELSEEEDEPAVSTSYTIISS